MKKKSAFDNFQNYYAAAAVNIGKTFGEHLAKLDDVTIHKYQLSTTNIKM